MEMGKQMLHRLRQKLREVFSRGPSRRRIDKLVAQRDESLRRVDELRTYASFCELEAKCWPEDSSDRTELMAYAGVARLHADETLRRWREIERALRTERFERITSSAGAARVDDRRSTKLALATLLVASLGLVVFVAACVALVSSTRTPNYEASAQVLFDQRSSQGDQQTYLTRSGEEIIPLPPPEAGQLEMLLQTMAEVIDTRPIAEETIGRLGLEMPPAELLSNLTVEQVESTRFIVLTYESNDPVEATRIVNTVAEVSSERILETRAGGSDLTAKLYEKAAVPAEPVSPNPLRNGLLTLVVGLALVGVLRLVRVI